MTDEIETPDGTIRVTDDPEEASLYATGFTVSEDEQVNLGNYENESFFASLRVQITPALELTEANRRYITQRIRDASEMVARHVRERVKDANSGGVDDYE